MGCIEHWRYRRLVKILVAIAALHGCLDVPWRSDGEPCTNDAECFGVCFKERCHGLKPFPCGPDSTALGQPCLRTTVPGENGCDRAVRAGRWHCGQEGESVCGDLPDTFRDVLGNRCNDDNIDGIDDSTSCSGGIERGFFLIDGEMRSSLQLGARTEAQYGIGSIRLGALDQCATREAGLWHYAEGKGEPVGWTFADPCHGLPNPVAKFKPGDYQGAWIAWKLPYLTNSDRFNLSIQLLRVERGWLCGSDRYRVPSALDVWLVSSDGDPRALSLSIDDPNAASPSVAARCVPLPLGYNTVYIFAFQKEPCSCDRPYCVGEAIISPSTLYLGQ